MGGQYSTDVAVLSGATDERRRTGSGAVQHGVATTAGRVALEYVQADERTLTRCSRTASKG